jgi:UDP-N-acetylmuramoyl-tripeptide--D-alanyl-D-alanine ligase
MGKIKITIKDLFNVPSATIYNPDAFKGVTNVVIDSRKAKKGSLFVAIKGEKFDGHDFVLTAVRNGAEAVVIDEKKLKKFNSLTIPVVTVNNTMKAYGDIAKIWRKKLNAKVICITGSNGKTTVKEMIATLLSEKYKVVKTEANNNNHIGVPLTILSADEKCDILVLELGTNHFGEIEYISDISQPDISIITNIGDSHLEFFKDPAGVFKEKSILFSVTDKCGGTVFINTDDPIIKKGSKFYKNKITYGFTGAADIKGKILQYTEDGRTIIKITTRNKTFKTTLPLYGESSAKNFLAATAVALSIGLTIKQIITGTSKFKQVDGRLKVKDLNNNIIIDDSYNSNSASIESAVELVTRIKKYRNKLIILGDIFELGKYSSKIHGELAKIFQPNNNLIVLTIGKKMKVLNKSLTQKKVKSIHFNSRKELSLYLKYANIENSVILIKGSRGMKMEEFLNILETRFAI